MSFGSAANDWLGHYVYRCRISEASAQNTDQETLQAALYYYVEDYCMSEPIAEKLMMRKKKPTKTKEDTPPIAVSVGASFVDVHIQVANMYGGVGTLE